MGSFKAPPRCKCPDYSWGRRTFQPYWRCTHGCLGCYARRGYRWSYWGSKSDGPVSVDLEAALEDYRRLPENSEIEAAPSCDAFDLAHERERRITREFLEALQGRVRGDVYFTFLTKSALIGEYAELLPAGQSVAQVTIEGYKGKTRITSRGASSYRERLDAVSRLSRAGVPVGVRIDPIIPSVDEEEELPRIVSDAQSAGAEHITVSFVKLYRDQVGAVSEALGKNLWRVMVPETDREFFVEPDLRREWALAIRDECGDRGLTFAMCREAVVEDTGLCDPFHLIGGYPRRGGSRGPQSTLDEFFS